MTVRTILTVPTALTVPTVLTGMFHALGLDIPHSWSRSGMRRSWIAGSIAVLAACNSDNTGPGRVLEAPSSLTSVSLDGAVALAWSDNSFQSDPNLFQNYSVYSTSYDLDLDQCGAQWRIEGTTVAPEFVVGALTNGIPRCFYVSAVSIDGLDSDASPLRNDTPRPDARNVVVFARQEQDAGSGFRFWQDGNGNGSVQESELGLVIPGSAVSADFTVEREAVGGRLFLTPRRPGVTVALYGAVPVDDLTSIDIAPETGFDPEGLEAVPGWGYVFRIDDGGPFFTYGAVRVTHAGQNLLILDWAYQTDPGNPELRRGRVGG